MPSLIGPPDAVGDGLGQAQEVLRVPSVEGRGFGFERALPEKGIVNGAAGELRLSGLLYRLEVLAFVEGNKRQVFADVAQEQLERGD